MDEATAWKVFNEGKQLDLTVNGRLLQGAMVTGLKLPGRMEILLRAKVGEPDRRIVVPIDQVEVGRPG